MSGLPERDRVLHVDLDGRDPDDGMTLVPYEKGALMLRTIERAVGRERFDAFLKSYFGHFAFRSITSTSRARADRYLNAITKTTTNSAMTASSKKPFIALPRSCLRTVRQASPTTSRLVNFQSPPARVSLSL